MRFSRGFDNVFIVTSPRINDHVSFVTEFSRGLMPEVRSRVWLYESLSGAVRALGVFLRHRRGTVVSSGGR